MKILSLFVILTCAFSVSAKVYTPKVLTDHVADLSGDWQSFMAYPEFQGKTGQELAEALHNYFADSITGFYHCTDVREECRWVDHMIEYNDNERFCYGLVRDPVELFNIWGFGLCYQVNPIHAGVLEALTGAGFDSVLCGGFRNWHTLMEVFYSGGCHYSDPEQRGYVKRANGTIPSWLEIGADTNLLNSNPYNITPYFPYPASLSHIGMITRDKFQLFADSSYRIANYYERYNRFWSRVHTMDFILRRGETLRRYWQSDSGRVYIQREKVNLSNPNPYWAGNAATLDTMFNRPPYGPKSWVTPSNGGSVNSTGMGVLLYNPDLTTAADYRDGIFIDSNMVHTASGPVLAQNGTGYVIFRTYSPYIIIGKANNVVDKNDDADGAKVQYVTQGQTSVKISTNFGYVWQDLEQGTNLNAAKDITVQCYGRHEYFIKFEFTGTAGAAGLSGFGTETWLSVAPMSLPRLAQGTNTISYKTGDVKGENTVPIRFPVLLSDSGQTNSMIFNRSGTYNPFSLQNKLVGSMVFKITAPSTGKFKWVTLGASVVSGWNQTRTYTFSASSDNSSYQTVFNFSPEPPWYRHWQGHKDGTVDLPGYGNVLYARYSCATTSGHGINRIMVHAAYEDTVFPASDPVMVSYHYTENGVDREYSFSAFNDTARSLSIAGAVVNKYIDISNPASGSTGVKKKPEQIQKGGLDIEIWPNPFNPAVIITITNYPPRLTLGEAGEFQITNMELKIFNTQGKLVQDLTPGIRHSIPWDASDQPSGMYVIRAMVNGKILTKPCMLLK